MGFTPRTIGDTRAIPSSFNTDSGTFSVSGLLANQFVMNFVNENSGVHTTGTGTWSSIAGNTAQYTPNAADAIVTTAGVYRWWPVVNGVPFDFQIVEVTDPTQVNV